jgi:hypothetical protein
MPARNPPGPKENPTVRAFLRALWPASGAVEVCVFNGKKPSHAGYFDDLEKAAKVIEAHDGRGNIYVTLNPVKRDLLARYNNRLAQGSYMTPVERTQDKEIIADSWLLIDIDPKRPSGISATDEEHAAATDVAWKVYDWLFDVGVPESSMIAAYSGNGAYVMVRLPDYPITSENMAIKKAIIKSIADKFDTDEVEINRTVHSPARPVCAIGTMKRKGENIPERPHRRSALVAIGGEDFDPAKDQRCAPFDLYALARESGIDSTREAKSKSLPVKWMSTVEEREVDWLMPGVPKGEVTIIDGDPKAGKSWITFSWASAVSNGEYYLLPGWSERAPGKVLIFSLENSSEKVIKPRLRHLGARMENIGVIDVPVVLDEGDMFSIEEAVARAKPDLIILDPIVAYIGGALDMNSANKVRQPMQRLQLLAAKFQCAVIVVRHLNKGNGSKAMYRGQGSIDFVASVRSAFVAVTNPENSNERALHHIACNLGREIEPRGYTIENTVDDIGVLRWTGAPQFKLENALTHQMTSHEDEADKKDAVSYLREILKNGEVASADVDEAFEAAGFSTYALKKAKRVLGVKAHAEKQSAEFKGKVKWFLSLPVSDTSTEEVAGEVEDGTEGVETVENRLLPLDNIYNSNNNNSLVEEVEGDKNRPLPTTSVTSSAAMEEVESPLEEVESVENQLLPSSDCNISSYATGSTEEVETIEKRPLPPSASTSSTAYSASDSGNSDSSGGLIMPTGGLEPDQEEAAGYPCVRAAASLGIFDIIGVSPGAIA